MEGIPIEENIISLWGTSIDKPLASVICTTYNQVDFIENALKGFLIQKTTFPFEIIIHDDASTDGTTKIIKHYARLYPRIIRTVIQTENQYSKGIKPGILMVLIAKGDYLAFCEGDDYWTDPNKLQLQCMYLETHPDISVTSHNACTIDTQGNVLVKSRLADKHKRDYTGIEMMQGKAYMLYQNMVCRSYDPSDVPEMHKVFNGDIFRISYLGQFGGSHYHEDIKPSIHIRNKNGIWSGMHRENRLDAQIVTWFWRYKYFKRIGKNDVAKVLWRAYLRKVFERATKWDIFKESLVKVFFVKDLYRFMKSFKN